MITIAYIAGIAVGYIAGYFFGRAAEIRRRIRHFDRIARAIEIPSTQENECKTPSPQP